MHPLVQLAARQWLETHGEVEKQKAEFIKLLHRSFPRGGSPNWIHSQSLFVHVESAFLHKPKSEEALKDWASLISDAACHARERGFFSQAKKMAYVALKTKIKILGEGHPGTLATMCRLAAAYSDFGRYREAEPLLLQATEISNRIFGLEPWNTHWYGKSRNYILAHRTR